MIRTKLAKSHNGTTTNDASKHFGVSPQGHAYRTHQIVWWIRLVLLGAILSLLLCSGVAAFGSAASAQEENASDLALENEMESGEVKQGDFEDVSADAGEAADESIEAEHEDGLGENSMDASEETAEADEDGEEADGEASQEEAEVQSDTVRLSYLIQPGDTLSEIALTLHTSVEYLAAYNDIPDPNLIYSGRKLYFELPQSNENEGEAEEQEGEEADQPNEAAAFRFMQEANAKGKIPQNALVEAEEKAESMQPEPVPGSDSTQPASSQPAGDALQPMTANIDNTHWRALGPGNIGGRMRAIVIHPTNPQIMWVGSVGGGIWKTTDGGASWHALDDFMANLAVSTLVIDPQNPNILYAGTGEGVYNSDALRGAGVFKSTDGGTTWNQLSSTTTPDFYYVNRLSISPTNSQVLLAATRTGIWRSADGGATWTQTLAKADNVGLLQVAFDPNDASKAIASGNYGQAYYSTDGGFNWTSSTKPWTATAWSARVELAYAPGSSNIVYASVNQNNGLIYKSTDGGHTYALVSTSVQNYLAIRNNQGSYDNAIWVSPTNSNVLVVGGPELFRSTDGGQTLTKISRWDCGSLDRAQKNSDCNGSLSAHADQHAIVPSPGYNGTTNRTLFFGNDGGIYKTQDILTVDQLSGWQELNNNLGITQFYSGAANVSSGTILGGTQDNGTPVNATGNSEDWGNVFEGDGGFVASDPTNPNYFYGEYINLEMYRSTNGGASSSYIYSGITDAGSTDADNESNALFIAPFILDPNNANTMLAGGRSLWRSTNVKSTTPSWTSIKGPIGTTYSDNISAIAVAPGNSNIIWVGYPGGYVYKTTNGTSASPTWTRVDTGAMPARFTTRITVSPTNSSVVYATFGGFSPDNVYKSTDGGATWSDITGAGATGLPEAPVRSLVVHPNNPNWLYVGTEVGVFTSDDGGANWSPAQQGPANVSVDELFWQGTRLVAATHGRGMFDIDTGARPVNDDFASAQTLTLTANSATASGTNVGATKEAGEPNHAGNNGGKSIWYRWTAQSSGDLTIDTRGSKDSAGNILDTTLGVYTGSTVGNLANAAAGSDAGADDENNAGGLITSKIGPFPVTAGTTYRIAIDGYNTNGAGAVSGNTVLNLAFTPTNDTIAPNVALSAPSDGATVSGGSVNLAAEATDNVGVTRVDFYVGGSKVGSDTTPGGASGNEYSFLWNSNNIANGNATVQAKAYDAANNEGVSSTRSITVNNNTAPANNNFAQAQVLTLAGNSATINGSNVGADKETGEPNHANNAGGKSIWYKWTAPENGNVTIDTAGSNFDTLLGVYTGSNVSSLAEAVPGNDDDGGLRTSKVSFKATSGTTYQIAVDGYNAASGNVVVNLAFNKVIYPTISGSSPTPERTGVSRKTNIKAFFSKQMNRSTLSKYTIKLYKENASTATPLRVTPSTDGKSVVLNPYGTTSKILAKRSWYVVEIRNDASGAKDIDGNPLKAGGLYSQSNNGPYVYWWFKTGA